MRESSIEKKVVADAVARGILVLKLNGPGDRGKPDRIFFWKGRTMVVEFKAPGKKPRPLQLKWIREFRRRGIPAYVVDDAGQGLELIGAFEKGAFLEIEQEKR